MLNLIPMIVLATVPPSIPIDSVFAHLPEMHAMRLAAPVVIDGGLAEPVWQKAVPVTNFVQRDPEQGASPSQKTEVRIAYDDKAIYIGARMWDTAPDSLLARLARRDVHVPADRFSVFLDPFHDGRNGYYFEINAAGTLYDGTLFNNEWDDGSWDGVWQGKAVVDRQGWTAEMRIPFSQLRFHRQERYLWGANFRRDIPRHNETDWVVFVPKNESGFVSRFPSLVGIESVNPGRFLEVLPYVTSRVEYVPASPGDPFNDGSRIKSQAGGDLRTSLGSNLTLNATVNPDFGQVEVDPAVVNLSDTETFFDEKRPFFVEGNTIYNFGNQGANNYSNFNWWDPKFFYTRRIGRTPQGSPPPADFVDAPAGTSILAAAKITGSVLGGWNIGTLHALTAKEAATYSSGGVRGTAEIEPATYYGVARALRGFHGDRQGLGFMGTLAARQFDDPALRDQLSHTSFLGGVDGWTSLDHDKTWVLSGWSAFSNVRGTAARLLDLQQNSLHYFQRPDSRYLTVDSAATSLTGLGTRLWLNKQSGRIISNSAIGFMSPRLDLQDMGFQGMSNVLNLHTLLGYKWTENGRFKKYSDLSGAIFSSMNYDRDRTQLGLYVSSFTEFRNAYSWEKYLFVTPENTSDRQTRGGPLMKRPGGATLGTYFDTDGNKKLFYFVSASVGGDQAGSRDWSVNPGFEWKPGSSVLLRMGPNVSRGITDAQYVGQYVDPLATATSGKRYVFAEIDQTTVSADITLNWSFTPALSLQMFAQPLIASGKYTEFKELSRPNSYEFLVYGQDGSTFDPASGIADPDGAGPAPPIAIGSRDFNFLSLRGNAVLRWEYRPGSTLFLVWTQTRQDTEPSGDFDLNHSTRQLTQLDASNIFLIKATWYLGL
ncbi:MAG: carbohydrate binding family 9 domain-containing protein [Candidatus Eisenbacteria bacterium]|nr:carbohydrate binding family 9 domain-containing protein [Candidatus Eisenbacteria bacterium]